MKRFSISLITIFYSFQALAWPPTFGSEFNFTNLRLDMAWNYRMNSGLGQAPQEAEHDQAFLLAQAIEEKCKPECEIVLKKNGKFGFTEYTILFNDGFQFNISVDPAVVEVQTHPAPFSDISKNSKRLQEMLFDVSQAVGLSTQSIRNQASSAHFNIGVQSAFGDDPESMLRFLVDYWSRPELALGVLGEDTANAPPLSHLSDQANVNLVELVERFNSHPEKYNLLSLAKEIETKVYFKTAVFKDGHYHYQSVGLKALTRSGRYPKEDVPIEIRAMFQPKTANEFALQAELINRRIEYLKSQKEKIAFVPLKKKAFTPSEKLNAYYMYLAECSLESRWDEFKKIIPAELHKVEVFDFFMKPGIFTEKTLTELPLMLRQLHLSPFLRKQMNELMLNPDFIMNPKAIEELKVFLSDPAYRIANQTFFDMLLSHESYENLEISKWYQEQSKLIPKKAKGLLGFIKSCDRYLSPLFRF